MDTKSQLLDGCGVLARLDAAEDIIDDEPPPSKRLPTKFNRYCSRSTLEEKTIVTKLFNRQKQQY